MSAAVQSAGPRVLPLPGYRMADVPAELVSYEDEVVMTYVQEFANLTQVPHASRLTQPVTEYLKVWATVHGVACEADAAGNVVMELPASPGRECAPVVAFQAHIDMVPAAAEGVVHDWAKDPLKLVWSKGEVCADGTSLGADNGAGVAFMQTYILYADRFVHGPMRFYYTVDEEIGLLGAHEMDAKYFQGVDDLINVDGGYGEGIVACAGGKYFTFSHAAEWIEPAADSAAFVLEFTGLKGGHSAGVGGGKANGLVAMANALLALSQAGVRFGIAGFEGGNANNAIPRSGKAVIVLNRADVGAAEQVLEGFAKQFRESYEAVEDEYAFTFGVSGAKVDRTLVPGLSEKLVQLMSAVPDGIHTLLATASGTESSSNLGTIAVTGESVSFTCFMRSSSVYQAEQITMINAALAQLTGFALDIPMTMAAWPLKADNRLGEEAAALYREMTGEEFRLSAIHAGVECGELAQKNPAMNILSTGIAGGRNGHTVEEAMNFDKVGASIDFLVRLAARLAGEG